MSAGRKAEFFAKTASASSDLVCSAQLGAQKHLKLPTSYKRDAERLVERWQQHSPARLLKHRDRT